MSDFRPMTDADMKATKGKPIIILNTRKNADGVYEVVFDDQRRTHAPRRAHKMKQAA